MLDSAGGHSPFITRPGLETAAKRADARNAHEHLARTCRIYLHGLELSRYMRLPHDGRNRLHAGGVSPSARSCEHQRR
jgi:hypothetical protein